MVCLFQKYIFRIFPLQCPERPLPRAHLPVRGPLPPAAGTDRHDGQRLHHSGHLLRQIRSNLQVKKCNHELLAQIVLARIRICIRMYVGGEIVKRKEREMTDPVLSLYKIVRAYV